MKVDEPWRKTARNERELHREVEALGLLGPASVRLLAVAGNELVLERVNPGMSLPEEPDAVATTEIAQALLKLWVPAPPGRGLPTVAEECEPLDDDETIAMLPSELVVEARRSTRTPACGRTREVRAAWRPPSRQPPPVP